MTKIGPISITGVIDASGSLKTGQMDLGPIKVNLKRVYRDGEF